MVQQSSTAKDTFSKRIERKFVVPEKIIRKHFIHRHAELSKMLVFDYISQDSFFNIIDNIYFDNFELESYHDAMEKKSKRHKLRLRNYAHDGIPEENIFFEIKSKLDKETFKVRLELRKSWLKSILETGHFPKEEILTLNKDKTLQEITETFDRIGHLTQDLKYHPILRITYSRFAFRLRNRKTVRITLDRDLRYARLNFCDKPRIPYPVQLNNNDIIVEIKGKRELSLDFISSMIKEFGEPTSFSKYCFGIDYTQDRFLLEDRERSLKAIESFRP